LDLVTLLRLALDNLSGLALSGQEIDLQRLSACHVMLSKLLPQAVSPTIPEPDFDGAAEEFARLVEARAGALEARAAHVGQQEIERLNASLAAKDEVIAGKDATIAALGGTVVANAASSPPAPAPAPAQTSPQPPLHASSSPYVRRGDGIVEIGRFGPKDWGNHQ
jgi:hypothetical protein